MSDIRILIADDHALVREGIRALLKMHEGIEVVGEAPDGLEAIKQVEKLRPDIVLMDISMPGLGGLEATLEIRNRYKDVKILILSQYDEAEYVARFLKAGVSLGHPGRG
jgi:DNA-binding NarL/FixJ family response regulator